MEPYIRTYSFLNSAKSGTFAVGSTGLEGGVA